MQNTLYLLSAILFIVGLKQLSSPRTARRGNTLASLGMFLAVLGALLKYQVLSLEMIAAGVIIGSIIGALLAIKVKMTGMPELVALFNGFGGAGSLLVASAELVRAGDSTTAQMGISITASILIGAVTLTGSLVAYIKLAEHFWGGSVGVPGQQVLNALMGIVCIVLGGIIVSNPTATWALVALIAVACVLGVTLVTPIGGADMPVVVALLNSYSGLAAAATGFVLNNNALIISGSLVGASGLILTNIMCKAMNRSLANVLFAKLQPDAAKSKSKADEVYEGRIKSTSAEEVAMVLEDARSVVFVPGYGMAVAQAQHAVRDLANVLGDRGVEVLYAIHPVAGRMPGHMNVLLAEADVPYDQLKAMEEINTSFVDTDVSIVIGANDVVNPDARTDKGSPIYGMPILDVDKSGTVIVIKRSLSPGFAGIPNPLFAADNTLMFFGDGKKAIVDTTTAMKEL